MQFWGWLPHLYPSFSLKFEPRAFASIVEMLNGIRISSNDDDPDETSAIEVGRIENFSYGTTSFNMSIAIGDVRISPEVTVFDSGMVCFNLDSDWDKLVSRLDEDKIRYAVRELYFSMKKVFHEDIHHRTDPLGSKHMRYADDNFAIVAAPDLKSAVLDIFGMIVRKCENTLSKYPNKRAPVDNFDSTVYSLISGFMSYGRNFLNVNRNVLDDWYGVCMESLASCERSLEGKDREMSNLAAMESESKSMEISRNTAEINRRLFWLTMLSIAVGFFAGSLLADSMSGLTTSAKAAVVVAAIVVVVVAAFGIHLSGNRKVASETEDAQDSDDRWPAIGIDLSL